MVPSRAHLRQNHDVNSIPHLQSTIGNQAVLRLLQAHTEACNTGAATIALPRLAHDFSRIPIHSPAVGVIQTKLQINRPGDEYEQEVDRLPEQVMKMPEPQLQRACACGGACSQCQMEQPSQEHERLQAKHVESSNSGPIAVPPIVHDVLRSPGQSLDPTTRAFMEPRFDYNFSRVRVHTDTRSAESAKAIGARAYTVGSEVVFGANQYAPSAVEGRRLLAHELTHVIQQGNTSRTESNGLYLSPLSTPMLFLQRKSSFPVTGIATCFGDKKDKAGGKGPTACGQITLPNEKDLFAAWPNLNKRCADVTKEGGNLPRVGCKGQLIVSLGGNSVQVAVQDCGPGEEGRIIDLSLAAVKKLDSSVTECNDWNNETVTVTAPSEAIKQQVERERLKGAPEYYERGRGIPAP